MKPDRVVFFDGVCNLCHGVVQFLIVRDSGKRLKYASLQGKAAKDFLPSELRQDLKTIAYYVDGKVYTRSDAVMAIAAELPLPWRWIRLFRGLPRFFRDWVYNLIAHSRYSIFGRKEVCPLPSNEQKELFLD